MKAKEYDKELDVSEDSPSDYSVMVRTLDFLNFRWILGFNLLISWRDFPSLIQTKSFFTT
jgi:hypothetical protein